MSVPLPSNPSRLGRGLRARGATLIEAMAALVVFTIGILGVMQMNVLASAQTNLARQQTTATTIARDMVDAFERLPYDHPAFSASTLSSDDPSFVDSDVTDGLHEYATTSAFTDARPIATSTMAIESLEKRDGDASPYRVTWRVAREMDPYDATLEQARRIAVMVSYTTPAGQRQVTLWTVKANISTVVGAQANIINLPDGGTTTQEAPVPEI